MDDWTDRCTCAFCLFLLILSILRVAKPEKFEFTDDMLRANNHHQGITERTHHETLILVGIAFFTQWSMQPN